MKRFDVTALGELLIDFTDSGESEHGNRLLEANPGGAPCNVLAMLQKLGKQTAFLGKVGQDAFGDLLEQTLQQLNGNMLLLHLGYLIQEGWIEEGELSLDIREQVDNAVTLYRLLQQLIDARIDFRQGQLVMPALTHQAQIQNAASLKEGGFQALIV